VRIGITALVALTLLYIGLNHLKGVNIFRPSNHYYVSMPDVSELQPSGPVYVDGFRVGLVHALFFDYDRPGHITVQIGLDKEMKVPAGSYAELKSGLTSGAYLNLQLNPHTSTYLTPGDTLVGEIQQGLMDRLGSELLPQAERLLPRLDSILAGIELLVNHPALSRSLEHIEATGAGLQRSSKQLNTLLEQEVPAVLANLEKITDDLAAVSGNLRQADIATTVETLNQTAENIRQITQQMNDTDNSLGLLLNDQSLYQQLDSAARNASNLLLDFKQNPKRYVRFSLF
jgi:phospholipid/cholesterol/gamma-HCH transport system substrate-binding protein